MELLKSNQKQQDLKCSLWHVLFWVWIQIYTKNDNPIVTSGALGGEKNV